MNLLRGQPDAGSKSPDEPADVRREAEVFGCYLVGSPISPAAVDLYDRASRVRTIPVPPSDARLIAFMLRNRRLVGPIDGALALVRPQSAVRKKLLLMAAILETRPEHAHLFLPGGGSAIGAVFAGVRGILRALVGLPLVRLI